MVRLIDAMARGHAVRYVIAPYIFSIDVEVRSSLAGRIARCIGQSMRGRPACWPNSPLRPQPTQINQGLMATTLPSFQGRRAQSLLRRMTQLIGAIRCAIAPYIF